MLNDEKYILNTIKYGPIIFVLLMSIFITQLFLYENEKHFKNEIKLIENNFLRNNKKRVKEEVERVYEYISKKKKDTEAELKKLIKEKVYEAHRIASNIYKEEMKLLSGSEEDSQKYILKSIKSTLGNMIYNDGRGYFFIDDINGIKLLQPLNKSFEGKNFLEFKDAKGYQFVKTIVKTIKNKTEAYDTYYWYKPNDKTKAYPKTSFYKYFAPLNAAIGTGEYLDDFKLKLKNELLEQIQNIRFGNDGYIFVTDLNGKVLSHIKEDYIGQDLHSLKVDGKFILQDIINFALKNKSGFHEYKSSTIPSQKIENSDKISYLKLFNDWGWVIGSGFYLDELKFEIEERKLSLLKSSEAAIYQIIYFSIGITLLFIILSFYLSSLVSKKFISYKELLKEEMEKSIEKEKLLAQQSKMALMGEMIGHIAHQWRQPLSVISASNGTLKLNSEYNNFTEEQINGAIKEIDTSVSYLSTTIDDFKNFFNPNKKTKQFKLGHIISKSFSLFGSELKINNIEIIYDVDNIQLNTYENELLQTLINIIKNAKDELIKNAKDEKKLLFISAKKEFENISIKIKDNAGGINEKIINKIFEPYFTTKINNEGTGIGLYMSKQLIEGMNGKISVSNVEYTYEDKLYKGAEFLVQL